MPKPKKSSIFVAGLIVLYLWSLFVLPSAAISASAQRRLSAWPAHYFAPYSYDASRQTDLAALARTTGTRFFTLAFIENGKGKTCWAAWNGRQAVGAWMRPSIDALRAVGGDVRVAFGGSSGTELANSCATVSSLQAQYQAVIDAYSLTHIDFDIEGKTLANSRANKLRNQVIAALQKRAIETGNPLNISYTLPVSVTGLTASGINLLRDAIHSGVNIAALNIMTMDYYSKHAPGNRMGQNAIKAANSVFRQLQRLYPAKSAAQIWDMLGITPMIGVNDDHHEVFTLRDAQTVVAFAQQQKIGLLSFWSIQHDHRCAKDEHAPHGCTGVRQQPHAYTQTFAPFVAS